MQNWSLPASASAAKMFAIMRGSSGIDDRGVHALGNRHGDEDLVHQLPLRQAIGDVGKPAGLVHLRMRRADLLHHPEGSHRIVAVCAHRPDQRVHEDVVGRHTVVLQPLDEAIRHLPDRCHVVGHAVVVEAQGNDARIVLLDEGDERLVAIRFRGDRVEERLLARHCKPRLHRRGHGGNRWRGGRRSPAGSTEMSHWIFSTSSVGKAPAFTSIQFAPAWTCFVASPWMVAASFSSTALRICLRVELMSSPMMSMGHLSGFGVSGRSGA